MVGAEAVDKLQLHALVFGSEALDAKASFLLGAAHCVPRHQALGAGGVVGGVPEEGAPKHLDRTEEGRWELQSTHGKGGEGTQDGVEQDDPTGRGE
jgi:hypothetical protein